MTDEEMREKVANVRQARLSAELVDALDDADTTPEDRELLTAWEMGLAAGDLLRWRANVSDADHQREVAYLSHHKAQEALSKADEELSSAEDWVAVADAWHADVLVRVAEFGGLLSEVDDVPAGWVVSHVEAAGGDGA